VAQRNLLRFSEIQTTKQFRNVFNGYALIKLSLAKFSLKYNKMLGDERRTVGDASVEYLKLAECGFNGSAFTLLM
jgi:hypothetical protein